MAIPKIAPDEEFRPVAIDGGIYADRYLISNYGRVVSLRYYGVVGRRGFLTSGKSTAGYVIVGLTKNKQVKKFLVHILVADAFIGPRPFGLHINHKNGDKEDPRVGNLEYCTPKENAQHAVEHELFAVGERIARSRLTEKQVRKIRSLHNGGVNQSAIARRYNLLPNHVCKIVNRQLWVHLDD